jgi:hypothetical protein
LRGRHRLTRSVEVFELGQELRDSVCDVACGRVALADPGRELSMCFVHSLEAGERFALFDESLFQFVDRALGDRDAARRFGFTPFEVCDCFLALAQARVLAFEFLLERSQGRA